MTLVRTFDLLARFAGIGALILGLAFWVGSLTVLTGLHMAFGLTVVLALWGLAALALRRGVASGPAALAALWGVATLALGVTQTGLLPGELHWLVQVAHLLLGLGAIALAASLARHLTAPTAR